MAPLPPAIANRVSGYRSTRNMAGESGGAVYRLDRDGAPSFYLKQGEGRVARDIADEAARLGWLAGRMPVPRVQGFVALGDAAWLLTSAVAGRTADEWFDDGGDRPRIVAGLARLLRRLHALPVADCPFDAAMAQRIDAARANVTGGCVDMDDVDDDHRGWTPERMFDALLALTPDAVDPAVTHGDYSLGNVLLDADGEVTGMIDVGRLGVADRYQDIAILWQNLTEFGGGLSDLFLREYGIDAADEHKLAFYRCLDEFF